jgi:hypothetical protein
MGQLQSATYYTTKWLTNYQSSGPAMTAGANAVQTAPGQLAANQKAYWLMKVTASADKWAARVSAVTLPQWRDAYTTLGITRGQAGAQAKQGNYTAFMAQYLQFLPGAVAQVNGMPKGNIQQSIARAAAMIQASAAWGAART